MRLRREAAGLSTRPVTLPAPGASRLSRSEPRQESVNSGQKAADGNCTRAHSIYQAYAKLILRRTRA